LIKAPSDKLFAFNQLALNFAFDSIQPNAKFLFSKLARFTLLDRPYEWQVDLSYSSRSLIDMFKEFKSLKKSTTTTAEDEHFEQLFRDLLCYKVDKATCNTNGTITTMDMRNQKFNNSSCWPDLKELIVSVDHFYEIKWKLFEKFPNLEKLKITSDECYVCSKWDLLFVFEKGERLKKLKMKVNTIGCIQTLARCFPELEELDLSGSRNMRNICRNVFSNFPNLKKLDLSDCFIRNFNPDAFNNLIKLDKLDISENDRLTMFQMKSSVAPRVLIANACRNLEMVKILDSGPAASLLAIEWLLLSSKTVFKGPSSLFVNTWVLAVNVMPTQCLTFDLFGSLEKLTISIKLGDLKQGQLSSLVHLEELELKGYYQRDKNGLLFKKKNYFSTA
jgi:hypothetical protein